jgi:hypothetical protein
MTETVQGDERLVYAWRDRKYRTALDRCDDWSTVKLSTSTLSITEIDGVAKQPRLLSL